MTAPKDSSVASSQEYCKKVVHKIHLHTRDSWISVTPSGTTKVWTRNLCRFFSFGSNWNGCSMTTIWQTTICHLNSLLNESAWTPVKHTLYHHYTNGNQWHTVMACNNKAQTTSYVHVFIHKISRKWRSHWHNSRLMYLDQIWIHEFH